VLKIVVLIGAALSLLLAACGGGDVFERTVAHKTVTGVKDGTSYTILVNRPGEGNPWISVKDEDYRAYFVAGVEDAVITESLEQLMLAEYSEVEYLVNVSVALDVSGTQPYRASREIFNRAKVGDGLRFRASGADVPEIVKVLEQPDVPEKGVLQGTVTIGPIWPVVPPGGNPPIPPEVYGARKIMVFDEDGATLIEEVDIIPDGDHGTYRVELPPGEYVVDINRLGVDHSDEVPAVIELGPGQTVELNIDIDTGIR